MGGATLCDFGAVGWDLLPGQDVAITYTEADADEVINVFRAPAPDLRVEKWVEGGGEVAADGVAIFGIRYQNEGDGPGQAILTDTMPAGTTYISDSSGLLPSITGNTIVWDLGNVPPREIPASFQLVLGHTADPGGTLRNQVDIAAPYETDPSDDHAEAQANVGSGQPDLYVNAKANPWDPTPGQQFRYEINYGNQGPVASGPVWLTGTLPLSTTLVSWQSENGYTLWHAMQVSGGRVILHAPALPGKWGDRLLLTLRLNEGVPYNTQLTNRVEISTTNDSDPGNNAFSDDKAWASPPRDDVSVSKAWGYGAPVPGGEINYWLGYGNQGNWPAHNVLLTDTLPTGTTFITAMVDLGWGVQVPLPPSRISGDQVVWDLDTLPVFAWQNLNVRLRVNSTVAPGAVLTNCATISSSGYEGSDPYDDSQCLVEVVRAAGPNLRASLRADWEGSNRLRYELLIENIGTATVSDVVITDTFPASMTVDNWYLKVGGQWSGDISGNRLVATLDTLEPGRSVWGELRLNVPTVPHGTLFTDTLEVTTPPGDVNRADNRDVLVMGTGPDLGITSNRLGGGIPKPGQLLTYTLHLQNRAQAWETAGNVWITDTLPTGLEFVGAWQRLCGPGVYLCERSPNHDDGDHLAWNYGRMWNSNWNDLVITVRVTDTIRGGAVLTNTAIIASDDPVSDVEPFTAGNDISIHAVTMPRPGSAYH